MFQVRCQTFMIMIWCAWGGLQFLKDEVLRQRLRDTSKYDQDFINNIAVKYEAACQTGRDEENLYGVSSYYVSKILLNGHTHLLAQKLSNGPKNLRQLCASWRCGYRHAAVSTRLHDSHSFYRVFGKWDSWHRRAEHRGGCWYARLVGPLASGRPIWFVLEPEDNHQLLELVGTVTAVDHRSS